MLRPNALRSLISHTSAHTARLHASKRIVLQSLNSRASVFAARPTIPLSRNVIASFSTTAFRPADPNKVLPDLSKEQEKLRNEKIQPTPGGVSTTSSLRPLTDMGPAEGSAEADVDMMKGIRSDLVRSSWSRE